MAIDNPKRCYKTHYPVRSFDLIGYSFIVVAKRQFGPKLKNEVRKI